MLAFIPFSTKGKLPEVPNIPGEPGPRQRGALEFDVCVSPCQAPACRCRRPARLPPWPRALPATPPVAVVVAREVVLAGWLG